MPTRRESVMELVDLIASNTKLLHEAVSKQNGLNAFHRAREIASAAAKISSRLAAFEDAELAGWQDAVERTVRQHQ